MIVADDVDSYAVHTGMNGGTRERYDEPMAALRRRHLLKAMAAAPLLSLLPHSPSAPAATRDVTLRRVRPSDPAWPSAALWDELKQAVDGNLIEVRSLLAPCATWLPGRACLDVLESLRNPFLLGDQPAGTQVSGWLDA